MTVKNNEQESKQGFMKRWSNRKLESQTEIESNVEQERLISALSPEENLKESELSNFKSDEDMIKALEIERPLIYVKASISIVPSLTYISKAALS